jgi:hypothetical protein
MRGTQETTRTRRLVVLLVGAPLSLVSRCRESAGRAGAILRDCDVALAASTADDWQPIALVVPEAVYAPKASELEAIARSSKSLLVRLSGDETQDELDARLRAIVAELAQ